MILLLAPHNDDEALFCSYIIQKFKPLVVVVTDSSRQQGVTADERRRESINAMQVLRAPIVFMGIPDNLLTGELLLERLRGFTPDLVFAPKVYTNGNQDHNIVGEVANELWNDKVLAYSTYKRDDLEPKGEIEVKPFSNEVELKNMALSMYVSQHKRNKCHFDAVRDRSEYYGYNRT